MSQSFDDELLTQFMQTFYGYGNFQAPYWFIGMEEGGGDTVAEVQRRLHTWQMRGGQTLEDVVDYHLALDITHPFAEHPKIQPTWGKLIRVLLSATGGAPTREQIRAYQRTQWARRDSNVCLLELLPLPSPSTRHWLYGEHSALPELATREQYRAVWAKRRSQGLQTFIAQHAPKAVIFYSVGYLDYWRMVAGTDFHDMADRGFYAVQQGNTRYIVMKHPAATGVTSAYFENVGAFVKDPLAEA